MATGECLHYGGGNIGRAMIGVVMHEAGLRTTFADVNEQLIDSFNDEGGYPVRVVSQDGSAETFVDDVAAVSVQDEAAMVERIVNADIITTAVGARVLPFVAPTLAKGLLERARRRPGDELHVAVVACENIEKNTETLRDLVLAELPDEDSRRRILEAVSFPNCAVDRIVPNSQGDSDHPLAVTTEDYHLLAVDKAGLKSPLPEIPGIQQVDDLEATLIQKLYTLNGPHVAAGYWAYLKGYETIDAGMGDPNIRQLVQGMMDEVSSVIVRKFPAITPEEQKAFADKTLRRFLNPYLHDQPQRVGREPKRKLSPNDRLLGPALLALEQGDAPAHITMAVIGGFRFDNPADSQAVELHETIKKDGIEAAVVAVTGLQRTHPLVKYTAAGYRTTELVA